MVALGLLFSLAVTIIQLTVNPVVWHASRPLVAIPLGLDWDSVCHLVDGGFVCFFQRTLMLLCLQKPAWGILLLVAFFLPVWGLLSTVFEAGGWPPTRTLCAFCCVRSLPCAVVSVAAHPVVRLPACCASAVPDPNLHCA